MRIPSRLRGEGEIPLTDHLVLQAVHREVCPGPGAKEEAEKKPSRENISSRLHLFKREPRVQAKTVWPAQGKALFLRRVTTALQSRLLI